MKTQYCRYSADFKARWPWKLSKATVSLPIYTISRQCLRIKASYSKGDDSGVAKRKVNASVISMLAEASGSSLRGGVQRTGITEGYHEFTPIAFHSARRACHSRTGGDRQYVSKRHGPTAPIRGRRSRFLYDLSDPVPYRRLPPTPPEAGRGGCAYPQPLPKREGANAVPPPSL